MIRQDLLEILCCPETHQSLTLADASLVESVNQRIIAGSVRNRSGKPVREKIDEGLVREDRKFLYPIRDEIPIMLIGEAVPIAPPGAVEA